MCIIVFICLPRSNLPSSSFHYMPWEADFYELHRLVDLGLLNAYSQWKMLAGHQGQGKSEIWLSVCFFLTHVLMTTSHSPLLLLNPTSNNCFLLLVLQVCEKWWLPSLLNPFISLMCLTWGYPCPFNHIFECAFCFLSGPCLIHYSNTDVFLFSFHCPFFISQ